MSKKLNWAIVGGGNGGQAMAGHIGVKGFSVKLYDVFEKTVDAINEKGGIELTGAVQGFGKVDMASTDISKVIEGTDIVVVVLPSLYHASIAKACAPHLEDGQIVVLHPGASCGALEFRRVLDESGCKADVVVAETQTLLYACRAKVPGEAYIFGVKNINEVAALPATQNKKVVEALNTAFPEFKEGKNVLATSLENINAMLHPAPSLLNVARIESEGEWQYYYDGFTPTVGQYIEDMDKERLELGRVLGLELRPMTEWFEVMYDAYGDTFADQVKVNKSYDGIMGQKTLKTRYVLEDVPNSLKAIVSLGKLAGVNVDRMETIVKLGEYMLGEDIDKGGRTVENLGLAGMSVQELVNYVETGARK
ncbi:opine dehydrogenase [Peptoclostridium litorale DSM 5388]|uniref:Opine dehydrogenase Odh n=1 Tax=Peptoclostridium litorale DSM 5388 TaxID=1121324 RepID=A0A069RK36_PEPLI|nr:NAD/NADP-dependent octopine/nopaline dehydrogenase family protein [Peptoclostridium litorale]KDR94582.1 opine dehydrogenase Odh [Peptoclostridium litorale DSM 5388]SIO31705.1 opine dehydrogenase [Peptoclostridium litorale DSM 5388]